MATIRFLLLLVVAISICSASSSNFYVRKGATGNNSGSDWNNAWNELSQVDTSDVPCGSTVWVAGGTYTTGLTIAKTCTASTVLRVARVLSTDSVPTSAAGWQSSYDSTVVIQDGGVELGFGAYYTLDGRKGTPTQNNFGIRIVCTDGEYGCDAVDGPTSGQPGTIDHVTITYVEMYGPACVMNESCSGGGASGLNLARDTTKMTNFLVDHNWIHRWGELIRTANWVNCTVQYNYLSDTHNDGQQHEDVMYNYAQTNLVMRYNKIWGSPNDGIFFDFGGTKGFYFYGNVYYHSGGQLITFKYDPSFTKATGIYYYNNVFENDGFGDYTPSWLDFSGADSTSGEFANNVMEAMYLVGTPPNPNHNAYTDQGQSDGGTGSFYYTVGNQFVNRDSSNPPAADFHLTSTGATTFANGKTLSAPYNVDADGNIRGADGHWYIGAYQYQSGSTSATTATTATTSATTASTSTHATTSTSASTATHATSTTTSTHATTATTTATTTHATSTTTATTATATTATTVSSTTGTAPSETLYTGTTTPSVALDDTQATNLGLKFQTSVAGKVTGIQVYRGAGVSITSGTLWSNTGTSLAQLTFNPSSSTTAGWIEASFSTPVSISASTNYVISYFCPNGKYAFSNTGFSSGRTVGHIVVAKDAGLYRYSSSVAFPNQQYADSEYFVSPIFVAN